MHWNSKDDSLRRHSIRLIALLYCLFFAHGALAQASLTTSGTDFWFGFMNNYVQGSDFEFTVFISAEETATGSIEIPLLGWSENFTVNPGATTAIEVPAMANNNFSGLVDNKGIQLTSDNPVSVYIMNHVDNSADATRVLPKNFLDINYHVNAYQGQTNIIDTLRSELLVVATEDATELEIIPACDMLGGIAQGVPFLVQMNAGETLLLKATELQDVSGTIITGTEQSGECRPFSVFGGSECSFVPALCSPCDHIFDQIVPSAVWGTEYYMVSFDTWISSYTYRITALQNGTQVSVNGVPSFNLNAGETQEVSSNEDAIFLSSNQAIGVIQYMEGGGCTISGDPSMMSVNSAQQTLTQITFTTIESTIVTDHHLQVIVPSTATGEVLLDGLLLDPTVFTPFTGNEARSFADINIPEGSHVLTCAQGFIANVYGIGDAESYLYSTGSGASEPPIEIENTFCTEDQVLLEASGNFTSVWWSTIEDPDTEIFSGPAFLIEAPIENQIYIMNGNNFLSGCAEQEFYEVASPAPLDVDILQAELNLCLFEEATLNSSVSPSSSSYVYEWSEASTFVINDEANGVIRPLESATYYLDVSTPSGCASGRDSVVVNIVNEDFTLIDAIASSNAICEGETLNLEVLYGANVGMEFLNGNSLTPELWSDFSGGEIADLCTAIGDASLVFNGAQPRFLVSADFDMSEGGNVQFAIQISDGTSTCDGAEFGEDVSLQFSTNGGVTWTNWFTLFEDLYPSFQTISLNIPVEAQSANTRFRWIQTNFSGLNEDLWWLDNMVFSAFESNDNALTWTSDALIDEPLSANPTSSPTEDTYYFVESNINGCSYTDSVLVEVQPGFDLIISEPSLICEPLPVPLSVEVSEPGFYTYSWSNQDLLNVSDAPNVIATPNENTSFTVTVTSPEGCSNTASTSIALVSSNPPQISPNTTTICSVPHELEVLVDGDPNDYSFEWSPSDILNVSDQQVVEASPAGGSFTTLEVQVTNNITGCSYTATQNLSALFAVFNLPSDTIICDSEGFVIEYEVINSSFNATQWNNPAVLDNAFTLFPTITEPDFNGDLIVNMFVPGNGGCSVSDTITIITQEIDYNAPDQLSICLGETLNLGVSGNFNTISWSDSDNLDSSNPNEAIASNTSNETFFFVLNEGESCALSDSIEVIINLPESFEITADGPFCEGGAILIDNPLQGFTYLWSTGSTDEDLTVSTAGVYSVQVSDSAGCSIDDEISIETILPEAFEILGETTACDGESITLTADLLSNNYLWSNGATEQSTSFSFSGEQAVWAEVIDANNCASRDSLTLVFNDPLQLEFIADAAICNGESGAIAVLVGDVEVLWSTGETSNEITVDEPGTYTVLISDAQGCTREESYQIGEVMFPVLDLDALFCEGEEVLIFPELGTDFSFSWSNGSNADQLLLNTAGNYSLLLSAMDCEQNYDFQVIEAALPELVILAEGPFCSYLAIDDPYPVTAISNGNIQWENAAAGVETIFPIQAGTYFVSSTSQEGCVREESIQLMNECPEPFIYAPNAFTPDNDGVNDTWQVVFDGELIAFELLIFNRDGDVVFRSENPNEAWLGNVKGGEYFAIDGVYNYIISYSHQSNNLFPISKELKGHITLIR